MDDDKFFDDYFKNENGSNGSEGYKTGAGLIDDVDFKEVNDFTEGNFVDDSFSDNVGFIDDDFSHDDFPDGGVFFDDYEDGGFTDDADFSNNDFCDDKFIDDNPMDDGFKDYCDIPVSNKQKVPRKTKNYFKEAYPPPRKKSKKR